GSLRGLFAVAGDGGGGGGEGQLRWFFGQAGLLYECGAVLARPPDFWLGNHYTHFAAHRWLAVRN
ncbi:unnamed protein product, partial [Urochloa humidicola]